jgi:hypothetical protein
LIVFGLFCMLGAGGLGFLLAWQTRDVLLRLDLGPITWTGHLYAVLVVGALLACWFLLGAAFIQCRLAERRSGRADRAAARVPSGRAASSGSGGDGSRGSDAGGGSRGSDAGGGSRGSDAGGGSPGSDAGAGRPGSDAGAGRPAASAARRRGPAKPVGP